MTANRKERRWTRIPIRFGDARAEDDGKAAEAEESSPAAAGHDDSQEADSAARNLEPVSEELGNPTGDPTSDEQLDSEIIADQTDRNITPGDEASGPIFAELIATRAELKRVQAEVVELRDKLARRQADFENFRKRVERERSETYNHVVAELAAKLLPVLDNLRRALDTEASVEASESDEFRHFLSGVDLIYKQLGGVLASLGVKAVPAVGEPFDPHVHEALATEETDEYEPDTVMQEIVPGYRLGAKLLRPAQVKVSVKR